MNFEYLIIEISLILLAFFVHVHHKLKLFSTKRQLFLFWLFAYLFGIVWDYYAIKRGHWVYQNVLGIFFFGIPIEDFLFIAVVGYLLVVAYRLFRHKNWFS